MRTSFEGIRVLLFGAEKDSIDSVKRPLIRHGFLVSTVESPKHVLKVAKNIPMDLLIVDHDSVDRSTNTDWRAFLSSPGTHIPAILLSKQQAAGSQPCGGLVFRNIWRSLFH